VLLDEADRLLDSAQRGTTDLCVVDHASLVHPREPTGVTPGVRKGPFAISPEQQNAGHGRHPAALMARDQTQRLQVSAGELPDASE
jgi:hypothetical protein